MESHMCPVGDVYFCLFSIMGSALAFAKDEAQGVSGKWPWAADIVDDGDSVHSIYVGGKVREQSAEPLRESAAAPRSEVVALAPRSQPLPFWVSPDGTRRVSLAELLWFVTRVVIRLANACPRLPTPR